MTLVIRRAEDADNTLGLLLVTQHRSHQRPRRRTAKPRTGCKCRRASAHARSRGRSRKQGTVGAVDAKEPREGPGAGGIQSEANGPELEGRWDESRVNSVG